MIVKQLKNYADSIVHCRSLGGALAIPESAEENQQIVDELNNDSKLIVNFPSSFATDKC